MFIKLNVLIAVVGSLRQEKLDLKSQVRKYEATLIHLQNLLHQSREEVSFLPLPHVWRECLHSRSVRKKMHL